MLLLKHTGARIDLPLVWAQVYDVACIVEDKYNVQFRIIIKDYANIDVVEIKCKYKNRTFVSSGNDSNANLFNCIINLLTFIEEESETDRNTNA